MFGIIFYIILGILSLISSLAFGVEDTSSRYEAMRQGKDIYIDRKGFSRLVSDNRPVTRTSIKGESVLVDTDNNIYRNLTYERLKLKEKQEFYYYEAIKNHYTTYLYLDRTDLNSFDMYNLRNQTRYKGNRYKDIKSGAIYVIRDVHYLNIFTGYYYIDISNGHIVREIDNPIYIVKPQKLSKSDIKMLNTKIDNKEYSICFAESLSADENGRKMYYQVS